MIASKQPSKLSQIIYFVYRMGVLITEHIQSAYVYLLILLVGPVQQAVCAYMYTEMYAQAGNEEIELFVVLAQMVEEPYI